MNSSVPVVVLATGNVGHGIARSLGRLGVPMYAVFADSRSPAAQSRYWRERFSWRITDTPAEASVDWLLQLGGRVGSKPILIPTNDRTCLFVADHADALRDAFRLPNQPAGLARSLSDKRQMYFLCQEHSIPTPGTVFPRSRADVLEFLRCATFPVVLKRITVAALRKRFSVGVVRDADTLLERYDEMETFDRPNLMVQEYVPGGSEDVWMFNGYFDDESACLFGATGRKIRQYPPYGGVTSLGVCLTNDALARQVKDFMKLIGYRGILDIGYKRDARTGEYKLLDANPRIGSTFRLFVDADGMDVARALYLDLTGQRIVCATPREGRKWVVENFDLFSSVQYWRDGELTTRGWASSFRGVEEACWFARDDPAPFGAMWWHSLRWWNSRMLSP